MEQIASVQIACPACGGQVRIGVVLGQSTPDSVTLILSQADLTRHVRYNCQPNGGGEPIIEMVSAA